MDTDLVLLILVHESDPVATCEHVEEEHDEEELHEGVLIRVQEAKTVHKGYLTIENQMSRLLIKGIRWEKDPVIICFSVIIFTKDIINKAAYIFIEGSVHFHGMVLAEQEKGGEDTLVWNAERLVIVDS